MTLLEQLRKKLRGDFRDASMVKSDGRFAWVECQHWHYEIEYRIYDLEKDLDRPILAVSGWDNGHTQADNFWKGLHYEK